MKNIWEYPSANDFIDAAHTDPQYINIEEPVLYTLYNFVKFGVPTGHFLYGVLTNNLFEAVNRADNNNKIELSNIVILIYNTTPTGCYGSEEKVNNWIKVKGWEGFLKESQKEEANA